MNLESDVKVGNTVPMYFYKDSFVEYDKVLLLKKLKKEKGVFVLNGSLYSYKWFKVRHSDGFETNRKIHFVVTDDLSKIPKEYLSLYSFELEEEFPDTVFCEDKVKNSHQ